MPQEESHTGLTSENEENALKCWAGDIPTWDRNGESWWCSWICAPMGQEPLLSLLVFHEGWLAVPTLGSLGCGQSWRWSMTSWLASEINIILLLWPPASLDWLDSWQPWHCAQNTMCYNTPTTKCAFQFGAKSFGITPPLILHLWQYLLALLLLPHRSCVDQAGWPKLLEVCWARKSCWTKDSFCWTFWSAATCNFQNWCLAPLVALRGVNLHPAWLIRSGLLKPVRFWSRLAQLQAMH